MTNAHEALKRLKAGNERYVANVRDISPLENQSRRADLLHAQSPFAIILGCSDSRVPTEIIFDQSLGDLFVVRVAGNIVTPALLGSVEFSAVQHGARLVVVLGHTQCGAIQATVNEVNEPSGKCSPNLQTIVDQIEPSVQAVLNAESGKDHNAIVQSATHANIKASVAQLQTDSQVLENLVASDGLQIIGAEYSLESGKVEFFD